jgi:hypothetical protein
MTPKGHAKHLLNGFMNVGVASKAGIRRGLCGFAVKTARVVEDSHMGRFPVLLDHQRG